MAWEESKIKRLKMEGSDHGDNIDDEEEEEEEGSVEATMILTW